MTEDEVTPPEGEILAAPEADLGGVAEAEVAFVVPAPAYESIATDRPGAEIDLPTPPGPVDLGPALGAIEALGEGLHRKLDGLQTLFDREIRAETTREKVVDRLHAELQEYKQGLILGILRPVFVDLIQLHDDIGKMVDAQGDLDGEAARLVDLMRGYQQGIEDILYRQGVEPFAVEGDTFDPRRQRALSTVPTDDPDRNKRVAARLRKGFQADDKVIRPEMVTVHSFKATAPPQAPSVETTDP
ncbi:nucleotide exchange factor GrpE [Tundrisphaera lichenicola]|uniref:nucleotide exchange factor GrpE n=1 Tax=Tundrisphaera lichenicola TaxID=2029860 RepID=UPI003EBC38EC